MQKHTLKKRNWRLLDFLILYHVNVDKLIQERNALLEKCDKLSAQLVYFKRLKEMRNPVFSFNEWIEISKTFDEIREICSVDGELGKRVIVSLDKLQKKLIQINGGQR